MRVRRACGPTASQLTSKTGQRLARRDSRNRSSTQATTPLSQTLSPTLVKKPKKISSQSRHIAKAFAKMARTVNMNI